MLAGDSEPIRRNRANQVIVEVCIQNGIADFVANALLWLIAAGAHAENSDSEITSCDLRVEEYICRIVVMSKNTATNIREA
jgi:hypothetical protein